MKDTKTCKVDRKEMTSSPSFTGVSLPSSSSTLTKCPVPELITVVCANYSACYSNDNYCGANGDSSAEGNGRYKNAHYNAVRIKLTDRVTNSAFTSLSSPLICTSDVKRAHNTHMLIKHEAATLSRSA